MKQSHLLLRNLIYYWRTNIPIIAGVALAVAVLSGALLVGQSVKASLRRLLFERIGATDYLLTADHFFGEKLATALDSDIKSCPIIFFKGVLIRENTGVPAHEVNVYGIDERFWKFHGADVPAFQDDHAGYVGQPLAKQLDIQSGDSLLLRVEIPQSIPREWLYGRRDASGRTMRLHCGRILADSELGQFSLRPTQGNVHSIFVPLKRLQRDLAQQSKVNAVLLSRTIKNNEYEEISNLLKINCALQDFGLHFQPLISRSGFSLESDQIILDSATAEAAVQTASSIGVDASPIYTYLANVIRAGAREIPYSVITAADIGEGALRSIRATPATSNTPGTADSSPPIWLTDWAQRDLHASDGESIEIEYYIWQQEGQLETRTATFRLAGILAASEDLDAALAPNIPGVTDARSMSAWDPPFPLDLKKIRPIDEDYWERYKTTPKAFISLSEGEKLWKSRFGKLTALRIALPPDQNYQSVSSRFSKDLLRRLNPLSSGFSLSPIRDQGMAASRGSTDFGEYFVYFSFFLIAAAVMLAVLFFRLMTEQRVREIGILQACGFSTRMLQRNFLCEGAILSVMGTGLGVLGSIIYGWLMVFGLRTLWTDAVGTRMIFLHISWAELLIGGIGGIFFSMVSIAWTLRTLRHNSIRLLLTGTLESMSTQKRRVRLLAFTSLFTLIAAIILLAASGWQKVSQLEGFFGAGFLLLVAILCATALHLRRSRSIPIAGHGLVALVKLGLRNATHRPARSLFCASLIAAATFIVVSMEAFRQGSESVSLERNSGTGGYSLLAESTLPILYDLNGTAGLDAVGLSPSQVRDFQRVHFVPFRQRPGDDASCLNLYAPQEPEIIGASQAFSTANRFSFQSSLAETQEQKNNPWLLLDAFPKESFIPAIADANTLQYILHLSLGSEFMLPGRNGSPVRLRFVAALRDSIFQGKLIISEANFLREFPEQEGYRFFLIDAPPSSAAPLIPQIQEGLADYGFAVESSTERLTAYHQVENTYLSTFQSLGTLGLVLGTVGLATVLLRNVLERRQELALLRAVGYRSPEISAIILTENVFLLVWGLFTGVICALIAILPAIHARGLAIPFTRTGWIVAAILAAGLISSFIALLAALRTSLLPALRSE